MSIGDALNAVGNPQADIQDALDVVTGKPINCTFKVTLEDGVSRTCKLSLRRHTSPHLDDDGWFNDEGQPADYP
jgi:hypothetical protein